jgi:Beta-galactosidase
MSRCFLVGLVTLCLALPAAAQVRQPHGFYIMQSLHAKSVSDSILASPQLSGIHLRDAWDLLEPAPGVFSFSWLDGQLARAKAADKQVTLGIYTGKHSPSWLGVPLVSGVPTPWDPRVTAANDAMIAALGQKYANDPSVVAVHMSAPATDASMEMHYPSGLTKAPGYSDAAVIQSWESSIDAYSQAFPNTALVLDLAMVPDVRGAVTNAVVDYAESTLGERVNFIHNSLHATTSLSYGPQALVTELGQQGYNVGFEMLSPSTSSRFGGTFGQALAIGQAAGADWYQIYQPDQKNIPANYVFPPAPLGVSVDVGGVVGLSLSTSIAIPEPSSVLMLLIAVPTLLIGRRWRSAG